MDAQTLREAMGNALPLSSYEALVPAANKAMRDAEITTVERAALWWAQLGHESVGLKFLTELWGPTSDQSSYEWRADLGNRGGGDGYRFRGRGAIMVTGRSNYAELSAWAHGRGLVPTPTFFVDDPDALASREHCFVGAVWFWSTRNINRFAEGREVTNSTHVINGGENGLQDRISRYNRCFPLGDRLLPDLEADPMGAVADSVNAQILGPNAQGWIDLLGRSVEVDPSRGRTVVEVLGVIFEQLTGAIEKGKDNPDRGKSFGGWGQLGDHLAPKRTLVDGIGRVIEQNNQIIGLLSKIAEGK